MTSISPPIQSVLELFQGPLANVRFADIDAAGLAKLAAEVEAAGAEVEQQEQRLTELRQLLAQRQEALLALAQQALAYARVYAENDEALLEELNRIALPRPASRAAKPRTQGRASASDRADPLLDTAEPAVDPELNEPSSASDPTADEAAARPGRKGRGRVAQAAAE